MTPQERDLITTLLDRLKGAGAGQQKDPEADALIRQPMRDMPDAPYYLVQTVLIQDLSLHQAQNRIAELEQQCQPRRRNHRGQLSRRPVRRPRGGAAGTGARRGKADRGAAARKWRRRSRRRAVAGICPARLRAAAGLSAAGLPAAARRHDVGHDGRRRGGGGFLRSAAATAAGRRRRRAAVPGHLLDVRPRLCQQPLAAPA